MRGRWRRRASAIDAALARHLRTAAGRHGGRHRPECAARDSRRRRSRRSPGAPAAVPRGAESLRSAGGAGTRCASSAARCETYAVALTKIANDIRWLGSGPRCGLGELKLPAVQPGSSIMPGKVNPVIAESVLMVCAQVIGYDATIAWCAAAGNFELNVMMPVMAYDLLQSIELLAAPPGTSRQRLIDGLEADRERAKAFVEQSLAMGTVARAGDRL